MRKSLLTKFLRCKINICSKTLIAGNPFHLARGSVNCAGTDKTERSGGVFLQQQGNCFGAGNQDVAYISFVRYLIVPEITMPMLFCIKFHSKCICLMILSPYNVNIPGNR